MTDVSRGMAGFTLLELLVTISLLGLLTMVMFGGMRFGAQVWARTGSDLTVSNAMRKAEDIVRSELGRAYPLYSIKDSMTQLAFSGDAHRIRYLTPSRNTPGALDDIVLEVRADGASEALARTARPELARSLSTTSTNLLSHVDTIEFAYFGISHGDVKPKWSGTWHQQTRLPMLIQVKIVTAGITNTFIVAPHLDADAGCDFDVLTKNCRGY